MNKNALSIALALAIATIGLASLSCSTRADTNVNSSLTTNRNATVEPVDTASIETTLKKLEAEWSNAYKTKDAATVKRIIADDAMLTSPDGTTGTKADEVQLAESGAFTSEGWETHYTKVTVLDADAAFITGRTVITKGKLKPPTGRIIDISGQYRFLDVYQKRNGNWQVVASQVTKIDKPAPAEATKTAAKQ